MILFGFPEILEFPDFAKFRRFLIAGCESVGSIGESGLRGVELGGAVKTMGSGGVRHEAENPQRGTRQKFLKCKPECPLERKRKSTQKSDRGEEERDAVKMNISSFWSRVLRKGILRGGSATQGMGGTSGA